MAEDFYYKLGMRESSGEYKLENPETHFIGKYQMGEEALAETGHYINDGTRANDWKGQWTGKDGIWSKDDFFKNQAVQEKAIREYHDTIWKEIKGKKIEQYAGQTIDGHEITIAGMIAGAHLVGAGGLSKYLKSGGDTVSSDTWRTTVVEYLELLKNCTTKFDGDYTSGDNTFQGGHGIDIFSGGKGFDTYNVGNGDTVNDSDHKGTVNFEGTSLSGGEWDKDKGAYIGDGGSYTLSGNTLKFTKGASTLTIQNYDQKEQSLGIVLGKKIEITISDATANEKEGTITFTAKIYPPLDEDFTFNVTTIDGSATGNVDYMSVPNGTITIKAGQTEAPPYSIAIASDGIYEISEEFMLYAHYEKGTYTGYDLGKVTGGTGVGTITDDPQGGNCPVAVQPNFGFNFDVPTPVVSASGGSYYYSGGGSGGGSYYTPRVYSGTTTYTQPAVMLPNVPVYECHYDVKLFSVAVVSLPVACLPSTPPLVFDLNKDGITSLSMAASLALFDYNADDIKEHTAWIQNGDALLVRDTNNDGLINNGSELFGDKTLKTDNTTASDGYDALSDYDTNQDGIINASDTDFNALKLWRDNGDGITQQGELKTLTEENITSITLPNTTPTPVTENGNTITNTSTYTQADGTTGSLKDVWFAYENIATETYFDTDGDGFSEKMESWMGANLFTCKTFSIQKALHVKIQNTVKGANDGAKNKVA